MMAQPQPQQQAIPREVIEKLGEPMGRRLIMADAALMAEQSLNEALQARIKELEDAKNKQEDTSPS